MKVKANEKSVIVLCFGNYLWLWSWELGSKTASLLICYNAGLIPLQYSAVG